MDEPMRLDEIDDWELYAKGLEAFICKWIDELEDCDTLQEMIRIRTASMNRYGRIHRQRQN